MATNPLNADVFDLESKISEWRNFLAQRTVISAQDIDELEDHLRGQIEHLGNSGLDDDEAFLIAVKRVGDIESVSREYAEVHSGRLWRNLVLAPQGTGSNWFNLELIVVLLLALGAAVAFKLPAAFGVVFEDPSTPLYAHNLPLFCLPFLALYFVWKRQLGKQGMVILAGIVTVLALAMNGFPFEPQGSTEVLAILHLPIVMWFAVGVMYSGDWWCTQSRRMDFIRFSGEFVIYYVLMALGGGVLTAFTIGMFSFIGFDVEWFAQEWILPAGAMGAVIVAGWLVESKQAAIENMAPVLTRVFTPLFTLLLVAFLITMLATGKGFDVQRDVLIGLDLLLILVLGLVLYAVSSRDPGEPTGYFDVLLLALIISALLVDVLALLAIAGRIFDMGYTPNRVAALGENLILLVSLSGYAWHYVHFLRHESGFNSIERWQTNYIPVYAIWAAIVVFAFPPLFGFA